MASIRLGRLLLLCGVTVVATNAMALPAVNQAPYFQGGVAQSFAVCKNSGETSINSELAIVDSDAGQTETWTVSSAPAHGALAGFPLSATSGGGVTTPSTLDYTPATGYSGVDSFSIQVSDGVATAVTTITVTVNPLPVLGSTLSPADVCSGLLFSYVPTSSTMGAAFNWHRVFVPGISNPTASGTGDPAETLSNITNDDVATTYIFTVSANGCSSQSNVVVTVHPTPRLTGVLNDTVCSGSTFNYTVSGPVSGTAFAWSRAVVAGITPAASATGTGNISETLANTAGGALNVVYAFVLSANGCTSTRDLVVTVYPQPAAAAITIMPAGDICTGTQFQNFGAASSPATGTSYTWSGVNATVMATGNTSQYSLVSFASAGNATVTLSVGGGTPCASNSTYSVVVGNNVAATGTVLYYNNNFIFQDNTQDSYQWGYDDAATLDSTLVPGATFQSYSNTIPDFGNKYYWVMTTKGGCAQKTYFNAPAVTTNVQSVNSAIMVGITPNPANEAINITLNNQPTGQVQVVLTDIMGQILKMQTTTGNALRMDIAGLPAGCYLVNCFENGLKIATSRFIKNQE